MSFDTRRGYFLGLHVYRKRPYGSMYAHAQRVYYVSYYPAKDRVHCRKMERTSDHGSREGGDGLSLKPRRLGLGARMLTTAGVFSMPRIRFELHEVCMCLCLLPCLYMYST